MDSLVLPAGLESLWRHSEAALGGLIETARRTITSGINGMGNSFTGGEIVLHPIGFSCGGISTGRHPCRAFEDPVEVERAYADMKSKRLERRGLFGRVDVPADGGSYLRVPVDQWFCGLAALAGAKPCGFGPRRIGKEAHIFAIGPSRSAGWPAIDTGRCDRIDEVPVCLGLAGAYGRPFFLFASKWPLPVPD